MSENKISEEVTVTPVIRDLERLFNRFIKLLRTLLKSIIFGIREFVAFVYRNFLVLAAVSIIGGLIGFFSTEIIPREYASNMVLKLNVDSKEQLINDIGYLNALIEKGASAELGEILKISEEETSTLKECDIYAYSTYLEKTEALNELYQNTDTALYRSLQLDELMAENNGEFSAKFKIVINASDQTIFAKIEKPLIAYLNRVPELNQLLKISKEKLKYERKIYEKEMQKLDTLMEVLNIAMIERAKTPGQSGSNTYVNFGEKETNGGMNALDIQERYIFYAQRISKINLQLEQHMSCYFVSSHLAPYGSKVGWGGLTRAVVVAFFSFALTALIILFRKLGRRKEV